MASTVTSTAILSSHSQNKQNTTIELLGKSMEDALNETMTSIETTLNMSILMTTLMTTTSEIITDNVSTIYTMELITDPTCQNVLLLFQEQTATTTTMDSTTLDLNETTLDSILFFNGPGITTTTATTITIMTTTTTTTMNTTTTTTTMVTTMTTTTSKYLIDNSKQ